MVVEKMIPKQLQKPEFRFCLLKKKEKVPFEKDWQNKGYAFNDPKLLQHINNGGNYGVIGGYGNLRIIDCDKKEFVEKIGKVFNTFKVRTGGGGIHIYIISDYDTNHVFTESRGELRANNYQCVGPSSQHPNGMFYDIIQNTEIMEISKSGVELVLGPYLRKNDVKSSLNEVKTEDTDKSRSGREWAEVCRLIKKELTKEKIFEKMQAFAKWSTASPQYREMTYEKAKKKIEEYKIGKAASIFERLRQAESFCKIQPLFYDESKNWWIWDFSMPGWKPTDETNILNSVSKSIGLDTTNSKTKTEILNGLQQIGRQNRPKKIKSTWIQFKDKIKDLETDDEFEVTPEYFVTNPINWKLGDSEEIPEIDKLFVSWVGEEHKQELYEVIAFCMIPEYFIHRIIVLIGSGANGKGTFLRIILKLIGRSNIISTTLERIMKGRFETAKLYKKSVCIMGETNFSTIQKTESIKGLTGQDLTPAEHKGKSPFDFENYAKIIIATNSLPMTTDKTMGFYRRWKIIDFKKQFTKEKEVLSNISESEYENLALKCFDVAKKLWKNRLFTNDGTFDDRKKKYEEKSNPVMLFIEKNFIKDINGHVVFGEFYDELLIFLTDGGYRLLGSNIVSSQLKDNGFEVKKTTKNKITTTRIYGISRTNTRNTLNTGNVTSQLYVGDGVENGAFEVFEVFEGKNKVFSYIKQHKECSFFDIKKSLKIEESELFKILKALKESGEIFEPKNDKYVVV